MKTNIKELSKITEQILSDNVSFIDLKDTMTALKALFLKVSKIDLETPENENPLYLESGNAIGPKWAAMCIEDMARTQRFICGVHQAMEHRKSTKIAAPVTILYVGTGPFATLVMPLTTMYSSEELQIILVEVNPQSFENLKGVIEAFNASSYIKEMYNEDASKIVISSEKGIDILLVECLQMGLEKEPQVEICYNLISQLSEEVILIPEEIKLDVSIFKSSDSISNPYYIKPIETVFSLNKKDIQSHLKSLKQNRPIFPKKIITIPPIEKKDVGIAITTEITVFGNQKLLLNQSGLTLPLMRYYLENEQEFEQLSTQYVCGSWPTLELKPIL